jgi:hypothetical protein
MDSPLEEMDSKIQFRANRPWFEASSELGSSHPRRGRIIRTVVGLGKPIELLRRLARRHSPPNDGTHALALASRN